MKKETKIIHDFVIAMPVYQGVDLMDVTAAYEIFQWMAENWQKKRVHLYLVAENMLGLTTRGGPSVGIQFMPHKTFEMVPEGDLLWIPGGDPEALVAQMENVNYVSFIQSRSQTAQFVASVCEGALIAANAGLLDGYEATTHWAFINCLKKYPKVKVAPGHPRYVHCGNRVTGGGISSGLDEALFLVKLIAGEKIANGVQKVIQYFPKPPTSGKIPPTPPCRMPKKIPIKLNTPTTTKV